MLCLCFLTFFTHRFQQQGGGGQNEEGALKKFGTGILDGKKSDLG
jgi:hypothetical protein